MPWTGIPFLTNALGLVLAFQIPPLNSTRIHGQQRKWPAQLELANAAANPIFSASQSGISLPVPQVRLANVT